MVNEVDKMLYKISIMVIDRWLIVNYTSEETVNVLPESLEIQKLLTYQLYRM